MKTREMAFNYMKKRLHWKETPDNIYREAIDYLISEKKSPEEVANFVHDNTIFRIKETKASRKENLERVKYVSEMTLLYFRS